MRGYFVIPSSVTCSACKYCGARPIVALAAKGEYVIKCPNDDTHYQTTPGLIDMEDWNLHNVPSITKEFDRVTTIAC